MAKINRSKIAVELSEMEGLKDEVNIAQIKELLKCYNEGLTLEEVVEIWQAYNKS